MKLHTPVLSYGLPVSNKSTDSIIPDPIVESWTIVVLYDRYRAGFLVTNSFFPPNSTGVHFHLPWSGCPHRSNHYCSKRPAIAVDGSLDAIINSERSYLNCPIARIDVKSDLYHERPRWFPYLIIYFGKKHRCLKLHLLYGATASQTAAQRRQRK